MPGPAVPLLEHLEDDLLILPCNAYSGIGHCELQFHVVCALGDKLDFEHHLASLGEL